MIIVPTPHIVLLLVYSPEIMTILPSLRPRELPITTFGNVVAIIVFKPHLLNFHRALTKRPANLFHSYNLIA
jgi:hypothetical protein